MQPQPEVLQGQLAPAARPAEPEDAWCDTCHHLSLMRAPWIVAVLSENRMHFERIEYRVAAYCTSGEGCQHRWVT